MSDDIVINFGLGGSVRAVHDDDYPFMDTHGCTPPRRASHVEPIQSGPNAGWWYVDMSPLGETFGYCLWPPLQTRKEALAVEVDHVQRRWVNGQTKEET